ncbi:MAG: radical SAM protein [Neomegalonema sp.]|nr:radical SAM protein [Neomegalonema sp.]
MLDTRPKWADPALTATGETRARVPLAGPWGRGATTLWFNTGTLCNIECASCYIESSPRNDALVYLSAAEVSGFLDQIKERQWPVREIGFTGGEPFMNRDFPAMLADSLSRGYEALVLTNAMRPLMRARVQAALLDLLEQHGQRLTLRVSLDHYTRARHDAERGLGSFDRALEGVNWLAQKGFSLSVAGRTMWNEPLAQAREGYGGLFEAQGWPIDPNDPARLVLFPEMDEDAPVPEITTACWGILGKRPHDVMCASTRMVVKRKGASAPAVLACTLIPYDPAFELGASLAEAERAVPLQHPHCAKFCVLGGASCS